MSVSTAVTTIDVRTIAPRDRHPVIFSTFRGLPTGQALELVNDHDPLPLHAQFQAEMGLAFAWDRLEAGPELWRVRITKLEIPAAGGRCCGACGGG